MLQNFEGTLLFVSHDRYFLDNMVDRIFAFEGNGVLKQYEGGYTDYMNKRPEEMNEISSNDDKVDVTQKQDSRETWGHQKKIKFTFKNSKN